MSLTPEDEVAFRDFAAWKHCQKDRGRGGDLLPLPRDVYAELVKAAFGPLFVVLVFAARTAGSSRRRSAAAPYLGRQPSPSFQYGSRADQARIRKLTPAGGCKWWRIVRGVDSGPVLDDALPDLMTYGLPWLRRRTAS